MSKFFEATHVQLVGGPLDGEEFVTPMFVPVIVCPVKREVDTMSAFPSPVVSAIGKAYYHWEKDNCWLFDGVKFDP